MTYQLCFILNFLACLFLMKVFNLMNVNANLKIEKLSFLFKSPLLSQRSYLNHTHPSISKSFTFVRLIITLTFLYLLLKIGQIFFGSLSWIEIILISPIIYFLTEAKGLFAQLIFSPFTSTHSIHRHPLLSRSLGDFWGKRWNVWVQDWLRDISHKHRKFLKRKIFFSFLFSGIFHEMMVNLPYFLFYNESYFGNMTLYFMLQGIGLWAEKTFLQNAALITKRIYLWLFILLPSPLFLSKPFIVFFGLSYE